MHWPVELADECLSQLFAAAYANRPLAPLTRDWLVRGILAHARQDLPLDQALCLAGGGKRTTRRRLLTLQRDLRLRQALDATALSTDVCTPWERCVRLAPLVQRFAADVWPRARGWESPPSDWPEWKRALFHAAKSGLPLPASAKGLLASWTRAGHYSLPRPGGSVLALYV